MKKVFRFIGSQDEIDYTTKSIEVEEQVVVKVSKRVWDNEGHRLSIEELKQLGLEVYVYPDQTKEYNDYHYFTPLFTYNPDLEPRVKEYKACFDELGIAYDSNTDQMKVAMDKKFGEGTIESAEFYARMEVALTNVKVNYQAAIKFMGDPEQYTPADDFITWYHTPLLIKYMPSANPEEPEYRAPYVATAETEAAELEENAQNAVEEAELQEKFEEEAKNSEEFTGTPEDGADTDKEPTVEA